MQDTILEKELANLDLSKVAALQQKRTVAFVNHFVTTTVQFLNHFMKTCEQNLMEFERKLEKVEATMVLLEARLSSIPEVNTLRPEPKVEVASESLPIDQGDKEQITNTEESDGHTNVEPENTENTGENTVQVQPEYERFVKMVQVGVPLQAVKLKLSLEGLDPNTLDTILSK